MTRFNPLCSALVITILMSLGFQPVFGMHFSFLSSLGSKETVIADFQKKISQSVAFSRLVNDMRRYTLHVDSGKKNRHHAGNLYQHSMWTEQTIAYWLRYGSVWTKQWGLSPRGQCILALACFLHDIGKAGDNVTTYSSKHDHDEVGFNYILGLAPYYLENGDIFDFRQLFDQLGITDDERKMIAIAVRIHLDFGSELMKRIFQDKVADKEVVYHEYMNKLASYALQAGYQHGVVDIRLLRFILAVSVADARASQPADGNCSLLFPFSCKLDAVWPTTENVYEKYRYATDGLFAYKTLLNMVRLDAFCF